MLHHTPLLVAIATIVMTSLVVAAWLVQRRTNDAGVIDAVWSGGFGLLAVLYAFVADGWIARRVAVAALLVSWSGRLATHIVLRLLGDGEEDGRYAKLRAEKGAKFASWSFWFFIAQGISVVLLSMPALLVMSNPRPALAWNDVVGIALFVAAILGESIADRQLARFRRDPSSRGQVCRVGLWRYSRHPNYFFEWLHWLAYPILAIGLPHAWIAWCAAALMLVLMLKVTGIPPTEARAIESRGERYREYQRTTSAFFPWFPKESST